MRLHGNFSGLLVGGIILCQVANAEYHYRGYGADRRDFIVFAVGGLSTLLLEMLLSRIEGVVKTCDEGCNIDYGFNGYLIRTCTKTCGFINVERQFYKTLSTSYLTVLSNYIR